MFYFTFINAMQYCSTSITIMIQIIFSYMIHKCKLPSVRTGGREFCRNCFAIWSQAASTGAKDINFVTSFWTVFWNLLLSVFSWTLYSILTTQQKGGRHTMLHTSLLKGVDEFSNKPILSDNFTEVIPVPIYSNKRHQQSNPGLSGDNISD